MEWWQILIFLFALYFAYSAGHWVGYGKGEQDTRELTEEIKRLNKNYSRRVRWARKPKQSRGINSRQNLKNKINSKSENRKDQFIDFRQIP